MNARDILNGPRYVLSLPRRNDKREALGRHLNGLGGLRNSGLWQTPHVLVDGPDIREPRWQGSFEGHLKMLRAMIDDHVPYALLCEDDVGFHADVVPVLNRTLQEAWDLQLDLLYLGYSKPERWTETRHVGGHLVQLRFATCTHAYVVWRHAAKRILRFGTDYLAHVRSPQAYDFWLAWYFKDELQAYATEPIVAYQRDGGVSDNTGNQLGERRWR